MESILKKPDLWETLKSVPYPIALYGMGNGADKIIKVLTDKGISFIGVFSSNSFRKSGKSFHGFPVVTLSELEERYGKLTVLMCFGSSRPEVIENVGKIKQKHLFFAPDVPVYGDILFDKEFYSSREKEHDSVYGMLADDLSKKTFENIIGYKLTGNVDSLFSCECEKGSVYEDILKLSDGETYLDLGAYRGDTVFEFTNYAPNYEKIYAVEPDKKTFTKLLAATEGTRSTECINACISDKSRIGLFNMNGSRGSSNRGGAAKVRYLTADEIIGDGNITYIKADVEGAETDFIRGAKNIIKTKKPKMMISCYHRSDDLINIPFEVLKLRKDYRIYMRHFPSIPAWDTVYLFI